MSKLEEKTVTELIDIIKQLKQEVKDRELDARRDVWKYQEKCNVLALKVEELNKDLSLQRNNFATVSNILENVNKLLQTKTEVSK